VAKGDPEQLKGKMQADVFFVPRGTQEEKSKRSSQLCRVSERWKTMPSKEKGKFDEMAKLMKYSMIKKQRIMDQQRVDPDAPKEPPSGFFLFHSEIHFEIRSIHPGDVAEKLGKMWNNLSDGEKQPYENKAVRLQEKYENDVADYTSKGKFDGGKSAEAETMASAQKKVEVVFHGAEEAHLETGLEKNINHVMNA
uniref:HMG box domain-containing protein n=1 Tax=Varanus komodoensis TaxID=61221 RepID=A0A8D2L0W2_VARKO